MSQFFYFDSLAKISTALIMFISAVVLAYSLSYLRGDRKKIQFLLLISLVTVLLIATFSSDNIFAFCSLWTASNFILVLLMIHKSSWRQSVESGMMAFTNFAIGSLFLFAAAIILNIQTGQTSIAAINSKQDISENTLLITTSLILIAALTQSAIYPFHRWLISSLNSPTPASAIMHAGLVNGGGILLARFAPLFFKIPDMMTLIFVVGIFSAIVGTLWKLLQSNVKAMLACSTMSQMGFMIAQCGMGLFPAAIAHLFWHGMFKSYLFLSSPGSWNEKRLNLPKRPRFKSLALASVCGVVGAIIFAKINKFEISNLDTTLVLVSVCFIAATQIALIANEKSSIKSFLSSLVLASFTSAIYASSVVFVERIAAPETFKPQPFNIYHLIGTSLLLIMWLAHLFLRSSSITKSKFFLKNYVRLLNASQPKPTTITSNRNQYNYR